MTLEMSNIEIFEEVLNEAFKPADQSNLTEENRDSKGRKFKISFPIVKSSKTRCCLYRYDPNKKDIFPYFSSISGLKKICDYILFAEEGDYLFIFLIELKKGTESAKKQLNASQEFVNYIINSAQRIGKAIDDKIAIRQIRVCDKNISRRKQNEDDNFKYVNNYCDYPYDNFYVEPMMQ